MRYAVMSIKPQYAKAIINGIKSFELRRRRPNFHPNDKVILYETSPGKKVFAIVEIAYILEDDIGKLWKTVKDSCAISEEDFHDYFKGCKTGYALKFINIEYLINPPSLSDIRDIVPNYCPPQFFHYLTENHPLYQFLINYPKRLSLN